MQDKEKKPPRHKKVDVEPGQPEYQPGVTGTPNQPVYDEDAEAEKKMEKQRPKKQIAEEEDSKIVNEQEQNQVINDDESGDASNSGASNNSTSGRKKNSGK